MLSKGAFPGNRTNRYTSLDDIMNHKKHLMKSFIAILIAFLSPTATHLINAKNSNYKDLGSSGYIICNYKVTYQPDSSKLETRTEYLQLSIGRDLTKFQSASSRVRDSLTSAAVSLPRAQRTQATIDFFTKSILSLPKSSFRYIIFKTPSTGKIFCYDWVGPNLYRYEEPNPLFKWILVDAKKTIAGHACQKATTAFAGRRFEAWFTREIPVSDGPYKFNGLPGLIVEVHDSNNRYSFELAKVSKVQRADDISFPGKSAIPTTKKALLAGQEAYALSIANRMAAMGNNVDTNNQQRNKKHSNPLELR